VSKRKLSAGRPARTDSLDRKQRILGVAMDCFVELGAADTTLTEIARRAGVDHKLVRYYYPTLDALHAGVVGRIFESMSASTGQVSPGADPLKALKSYIEGYFAWMDQNPTEGTLFIYFYYLASYKKDFTAINLRARETGRDRIGGMIEALVRSGQARADARATRELAQDVQSLLTGALIAATTEGQDLRKAARATWAGISAHLQIS
jgi:AcrR family transcriptional regulator